MLSKDGRIEFEGQYLLVLVMERLYLGPLSSDDEGRSVFGPIFPLLVMEDQYLGPIFQVLVIEVQYLNCV